MKMQKKLLKEIKKLIPETEHVSLDFSIHEKEIWYNMYVWNKEGNIVFKEFSTQATSITKCVKELIEKVKKHEATKSTT